MKNHHIATLILISVLFPTLALSDISLSGSARMEAQPNTSESSRKSDSRKNNNPFRDNINRLNKSDIVRPGLGPDGDSNRSYFERPEGPGPHNPFN